MSISRASTTPWSNARCLIMACSRRFSCADPPARRSRSRAVIRCTTYTTGSGDLVPACRGCRIGVEQWARRDLIFHQPPVLDPARAVHGRSILAAQYPGQPARNERADIRTDASRSGRAACAGSAPRVHRGGGFRMSFDSRDPDSERSIEWILRWIQDWTPIIKAAQQSARTASSSYGGGGGGGGGGAYFWAGGSVIAAASGLPGSAARRAGRRPVRRCTRSAAGHS